MFDGKVLISDDGKPKMCDDGLVELATETEEGIIPAASGSLAVIPKLSCLSIGRRETLELREPGSVPIDTLPGSDDGIFECIPTTPLFVGVFFLDSALTFGHSRRLDSINIDIFLLCLHSFSINYRIMMQCKLNLAILCRSSRQPPIEVRID